MTGTIPQEYQDQIADLARTTSNLLQRAKPRQRKRVIDEAARRVMEISMRIVFDRLAKEIIEGMAADSRQRVAMSKCYSGAAPQPGAPPAPPPMRKLPCS